MNQFQNTESGAGILKDYYDTNSPLEEALKRKRIKLAQGKGMDIQSEEEKENAS